MMALTLARLRADPGRLDTVIDVLANLEADFQLEVDGNVIYEEVSFPVAELANALTKWTRSGGATRPDFEFDSMSAEEPGLVWIRRVDHGWRLGLIRQDHPATTVFTTRQVDEDIRKYVDDLTSQVAEVFGERVSERLLDALGSDL